MKVYVICIIKCFNKRSDTDTELKLARSLSEKTLKLGLSQYKNASICIVYNSTKNLSLQSFSVH